MTQNSDSPKTSDVDASRSTLCSTAALRVLKEIAQIANLLSGASCCEEHETQNWRELQKRLLMFRDDSFSSLKPQRARSIAVWPDTISVGNVVGKNESSDEHDSPEAAHAVCWMLERDGFGGEGKVFPISTRVEPIE